MRNRQIPSRSQITGLGQLSERDIAETQRGRDHRPPVSSHERMINRKLMEIAIERERIQRIGPTPARRTYKVNIDRSPAIGRKESHRSRRHRLAWKVRT